MKKLLITFFNIKGIVRFEFIPQGQTVNQAYYVDTLMRLRAAVRTERPANRALSVNQFLAQKSVTDMENAPCFPYSTPNDLSVSKIKSALKGRRFQDIEAIKKM
jgi:hypothetical protein